MGRCIRESQGANLGPIKLPNAFICDEANRPTGEKKFTIHSAIGKLSGVLTYRRDTTLPLMVLQ
jgi:hypothetical protein